MAKPGRATLVFLSPIGRLRVTATREHLIEVKLRAPDLPESRVDTEATALAERARAEIEDYLAGRLQEFTVPWQLNLSPLDHRVLIEMAKVPYARSTTYGELARNSGQSTGASRVVGRICGINPIPLVIPCHRVLAADGLGGFGGGLDMKRWLLQLETTGRPPAPLRIDGSAEPSEEPIADPLAGGVQGSLFD